MRDRIRCYLEGLTGLPIVLEKSRLALPPFLDRYEFYKTRICGLALALATVRNDEQTPLEYKRVGEKLESYLKAPVAFVFNTLPTNKRNALLRHRVPFVIPGRQIFLPPMIELREHEPREVFVGERLHFPAQAVVICELLRGDVSALSLKDLGERLGFSAMSMTTAANELKAIGLAEIRDGVPRRIVFALKGKDLWERARPHLSSPVKRRLYVVSDVLDQPVAGMSALSERTMIASDRHVIRAVGETEYRKLGKLKAVESVDEAAAVLEVWGYDPLLVGNGAVDDFSLWLSLQQEAKVDPRVEGELESLMEGHKWR